MQNQSQDKITRKVSVIKSLQQQDDTLDEANAVFSDDHLNFDQSEDFVQQLIEQAQKAKMEKLYEKILESIMIEKEQRIITSGRSKINLKQDKPLEQISTQDNAYYEKLSEEFYGKPNTKTQDSIDTLIKLFLDKLKELQSLWNQINILVEKEKPKSYGEPIKKVQVNFIRKVHKTSSPSRLKIQHIDLKAVKQTRDESNKKILLLKKIKNDSSSCDIKPDSLSMRSYQSKNKIPQTSDNNIKIQRENSYQKQFRENLETLKIQSRSKQRLYLNYEKRDQSPQQNVREKVQNGLLLIRRMVVEFLCDQ